MLSQLLNYAYLRHLPVDTSRSDVLSFHPIGNSSHIDDKIPDLSHEIILVDVPLTSTSALDIHVGRDHTKSDK